MGGSTSGFYKRCKLPVTDRQLNEAHRANTIDILMHGTPLTPTPTVDRPAINNTGRTLLNATARTLPLPPRLGWVITPTYRWGCQQRVAAGHRIGTQHCGISSNAESNEPAGPGRTAPDSLDNPPDESPAHRTQPDSPDLCQGPLNPQVPGSSPRGCTNKTPGQRLGIAPSGPPVSSLG